MYNDLFWFLQISSPVQASTLPGGQGPSANSELVQSKLYSVSSLLSLSLQHPRNTEAKISERIATYNSYIEELADCFPWAQHLNADQDPLTVFECIENMIVNPLPKQPNLVHST